MTPTPPPPPGPQQEAHPIGPRRGNEPPRDNGKGQTPEHQDTHDSGDGEQARQDHELWKAQRTALAKAFPDWEITCVTDLCIPLWYALYRPPLTRQQERDGFQPTMLRGSAEELQAELARRCRTRHLPLSLSGP